METDFVIIGAGSAGCVLADRLSAKGAQVTLLEAGPDDTNIMIRVPAGAIRLRGHPLYDWNYVTAQQPETQNRTFKWARGKVIGGTSSINGMNYVRGHRADFDMWAQMGCRGWSYADVLPYFKSIERYDHGDPEFRGRNGPLKIEDYTVVLPVTHRFREAAEQAGLPFNPDINGANASEGVGYSQMSRAGRFRASSAQAFLRSARRRRNLRVETAAHVTRLLFDGSRCTGVAFRQRGEEKMLRARREVIVSAGAINSPQILQLSGVGDPEHLSSIGVDVVQALPQVGENLRDHYAAPIVCQVEGLLTVNDLGRYPRLSLEMMRWLITGKGALTFGATTVSVFCRSRPDLVKPDIQLLFFPGNTREREPNELSRISAVRLSVAAANPQSRGSVMARSSDPFAAPVIRPGYLTATEDIDIILAGVKIARRIFTSPAMAAHIVTEVRPGAAIASDEELTQWIRGDGRTVYHPIGTCRMGEDDGAVVDSRLRVHGVGGLRVVDASVMPTLTTGNTNAPTVMIAEKASAMIVQDNFG